MRRNKIGRKTVPLTEVNKLGDPLVCGCGWTTNLQRTINALDSLNRITIEFEVGFLCACPEVMQVWFVPHFKEPRTHLFSAVAFDPMNHQFAYEIGPLLVIFWRGDVAFITENRLPTRRKSFWHEAQ